VKSALVDRDVDRRVLDAIDDALVDRVLRLHEAGYDDESVIALALGRDVDLHLAVELRARGCPVETALRILL
jgi:hypothetical protein